MVENKESTSARKCILRIIRAVERLQSRRAILFLGLIVVSAIGGFLIFQGQRDLCVDVAKTGIPREECAALIALYEATGGHEWWNHVAIQNSDHDYGEWLQNQFGGKLNDDSVWIASRTPCDWYGVVCDGGHIIEIHLEGNGLRGEIPPALAHLSRKFGCQAVVVGRLHPALYGAGRSVHLA